MLKPLSKPFARLALRYDDRTGQQRQIQIHLQIHSEQARDTDTSQTASIDSARVDEVRFAFAEMGNRIDVGFIHFHKLNSEFKFTCSTFGQLCLWSTSPKRLACALILSFFSWHPLSPSLCRSLCLSECPSCVVCLNIVND